jgi:hypothetical protein
MKERSVDHTLCFNSVFLQARFEQRENGFNLFYQELKDCYTPGKVAATREYSFDPLYRVFKDCFPSGKIGSRREEI